MNMQFAKRLSRNFIETVKNNQLKVIAGAALLVPLLGILLFATQQPISQSSSPSIVNPQSTKSYARAKVISVREDTADSAGVQYITAQLLDGQFKGSTIQTRRYGFAHVGERYRSLPIGSKIVVNGSPNDSKNYIFIDTYRVVSGIWLVILFVVLVAVIGRWRGITAIAGLLVSVGVLAYYIVPSIAHGNNAFATCAIGAFIIATISIFIAHGWNKRTSIAFIGSATTLSLTILLAYISGRVTGLSGLVGEDALNIDYVQLHISLADMLFGGIIIASLGVLNDITTSQSAAVDELYKAHNKQSFSKLYQAGMSVGREHIAALVNTLALAYVGVALPSIIFTALYNHAPLLVLLNSELVMQEIVRTAVASISLLLAVPITTALAAYILPRWYSRTNSGAKRNLAKPEH